MNNKLTFQAGRPDQWTAAMLFFFPILSLLTRNGASVASFLFLIAAIVWWPAGRADFARHWPATRWVVAAFAAHAVFAAGAYFLRTGVPLASIEKPLRMLLAASALLLVLGTRPSARSLWWGCIAAAVGGCVAIGIERVLLDYERPGGQINPITYGDLAMCLGLLCVAGAIELRESAHARWAALGALAGLAASIITGTRGGMLGMLLGAVVLARYGGLLKSRLAALLLAIGLGLAGAAWFLPQSELRERVEEGIDDVRSYYRGGNVYTHLGVRLELWKGAWLLAQEKPLLGQSIASYKARLHRFADVGEIDAQVLPAPHLHNDSLQMLVTGGVLGLLAWLATLAAPFAFFVQSLSGPYSKQRAALSLAGMLVVAGYLGFGLTEVIFWSVSASMFYALAVFLLMGLCLNAKDNNGK